MKKICLLIFLFSYEVKAQWIDWCVPDHFYNFQELEKLYPYITRITPDPDLIDIRRPKYETNPEASFCKRPMEMLDTVVFHHSETASSWTPEMINALHLERSTNNDPWYMIAYSYVISSPYRGETLPVPEVAQGRPLDIVGAHAGGESYVSMDEIQTKLWTEGKVTCGKEGGVFQVDPDLLRNGKIKANVTTVGVVITGNYAPFSKLNPLGYKKDNPRNPTQETLVMAAKMSCQLQKKNPRIKKIGWHSQYKATACPGTIKNYISEIKTIAKGYGCEFN